MVSISFICTYTLDGDIVTMRIIKNISIGQIDIDRFPMCLCTLDLAIKMQNGLIPPIKVLPLQKGRYRILDGRHRILAHKLNGRNVIKAKFYQD